MESTLRAKNGPASPNVLDYGPVQFEQKTLKLWLPLEAEIYLDVNGKRLRHSHTYCDYRVFSVDWGLKPGDPSSVRPNP